MKRLATPLLAALLLSAAAASAQTTFRLGVRGGLNRASTTLAAASNSATTAVQFSADKSSLFAWQAGVVLEARFGKLALQPALLFSQKGEQFTTARSYVGLGSGLSSTTESTNRYNWLELPVNLVYTRHGDHGWQVIGGPYVALGVGGRQRGSTITTGTANVDPIPFHSFNNQVSYGKGTYNRRLDAGVNVGVGYRQGPVQVQLSYSLGLRNLHQQPADDIIIEYPQFYHDFEADVAYNRVAQLTGTYFFGH